MGFIAHDFITMTLSCIEPHSGSAFIENLGQIFWFLDIPCNLRTGVYIDGNLCMEPRKIAKCYIKSWFFVDVLVVSLSFVQFCSSSMTSFASPGMLVKLTRATRTIRMFSKLGKIVQQISQFFDNINSPGLLAVCNVGGCLLLTMLWCHTAACGWYYIGKGLWTADNGLHETDLVTKYLASLNFAIGQLQGSTDIVAGVSVKERICHCCIVVVSMVLLTFFGSQLTNAVIDARTTFHERNRHVEDTCAYMLARKISTNLMDTIKKHLSHEVKSGLGQDKEYEVLTHLPTRLRRALLLESRGDIVNLALPFAALNNIHPRAFERLCCSTLRTQNYPPDELVFCWEESCHCMLFVASGKFEYMQCNHALRELTGVLDKSDDGSSDRASGRSSARNREGTLTTSMYFSLRSGMHLCEAILWCKWHHAGELNAHTYASLYELHYRFRKPCGAVSTDT